MVANLIKLDSSYQLCDGANPIGEIFLTQDPWSELEDRISEGEIRTAVVDSIGWTAAELVIEDDITTFLMSQDIRLEAWEEINQVLRLGELVKVRIETIDKVARKIIVSFIDKICV